MHFPYFHMGIKTGLPRFLSTHSHPMDLIEVEGWLSKRAQDMGKAASCSWQLDVMFMIFIMTTMWGPQTLCLLVYDTPSNYGDNYQNPSYCSYKPT